MKRFQRLSQGGIYRSREGILLGVCRGVADYFDFSVFWIRAITVVLFIISGFWPIAGIYFIAALIMKPKPVLPIDTDEEQEFYDTYTHSRKSAAIRIKRRYENLDRRLQRLEHTVTTPEFDWERRFKT